jgi:CBS-domain-containing membrane protein
LPLRSKRRRKVLIAKQSRAAKKVAIFPFRISIKVYRIGKTHYFPKMRGGHPTPERPQFFYILATWLCSLIAISTLYGVSHWTDSVMIMAPFGATCVLVFGAPDSPLAQPRNVIGGHLIATAISLLLLQTLGNSWWVVALGISTTIGVMQYTKTLHPPAGADPLVVLLTQAPWSFIFIPVLMGAVILVLCGVITNNFAKDRHYPKYWW